MARHAEIKVKLKKKEKQTLQKLLSGGECKVRTMKRANVLLLMNNGLSSPKAAQGAQVSPETARAIVARYHDGGLKRALYDAPRPGNPPLLDEKTGNRIIALVCGPPPSGCERWTLRLIQREVIKKRIIKTIGQETIRQLLHSHDIKPWREKNVVCVDIDVRVHRKNGKLVRTIRRKLS